MDADSSPPAARPGSGGRVALNPRYATRDHDGIVQATSVPGGRWNLHVTAGLDGWELLLTARSPDQPGGGRVLSGADRQAVVTASGQWRTSAADLVMDTTHRIGHLTLTPHASAAFPRIAVVNVRPRTSGDNPEAGTPPPRHTTRR